MNEKKQIVKRNNFQEKLQEMEVGDFIKYGCRDILRMPTGWVLSVDTGGTGVTSVFVPDVLNVQAQVQNNY